MTQSLQAAAFDNLSDSQCTLCLLHHHVWLASTGTGFLLNPWQVITHRNVEALTMRWRASTLRADSIPSARLRPCKGRGCYG